MLMPLGANPLRTLMPDLPEAPSYTDEESDKKRPTSIGVWRGSLLREGCPLRSINDYEFITRSDINNRAVLPSYHPAYIARSFSDHAWSVLDFKRARQFLDGTYQWPHQREWYLNDPAQFERVIDQVILGKENCAALDTEMWPEKIVAVVTEEEVHSFVYNSQFKGLLQR